MKKKKNIKLIIILIAVAFVLVASILIYKNLFASSNSTRLDGIESHKLTNNEKNSIKDTLGEIENLDNIDIHINSKIIKIIVNLTDDANLENVKAISNKCLSEISEENLSFYDVEIFISSSNQESETYPIIGYKHKNNSEFSW